MSFTSKKATANRMMAGEAYIGVRSTNDGGCEMNQTKKTSVARKKKRYPSNGVRIHDIILATAFITSRHRAVKRKASMIDLSSRILLRS